MTLSKKNVFLLLLGIFCVRNTVAQEVVDSLTNVGSNNYQVTALRLEARADFDFQSYNDTTKNRAGFGGKYLNFIINGNITDKFSYHYRQRLNLNNVSFSSFWQGCDWMYLNYYAHKNVTLSAGKQVILIGGFEYDFAPIDVYYWSEFWNNVVCYEMGASISFHNEKKSHTLTFQFVNSPFVQRTFDNLFAYNLIWYGQMKFFQTIYSINMIEYEKGKFINYISLGNKFTFKNLSFFVDFQNRATLKQRFLFEDFTLVGEIDYLLNKRWNIFAKGGYDRNVAQDESTILPSDYFDRFVVPGTNYFYYGLGAEFFPIKDSKTVRVHAFFAAKHSQTICYHANVGLTWKIDLLKAFSKEHRRQMNLYKQERKDRKQKNKTINDEV